MFRLVFICLMGCFLVLTGCDVFKGGKGDKGEPGSGVEVKQTVYAGFPDSNPFDLQLVENTDPYQQTIEVYARSGEVLHGMPYTSQDYYHSYSINGNHVVFKTKHTTGTTPTAALENPDGTTMEYVVIVKTLMTSASGAPDHSDLIYGR